MDKIIQETLLPRLFFGNMKTLSPVVGVLSTTPVNKAGIEIMNAVTLEQEKYLSSQRGSAELIRAVTGEGTFSNDDHLRTLSEEGRDRKKD